eukprot:gene4971-3569_t
MTVLDVPARLWTETRIIMTKKKKPKQFTIPQIFRFFIFPLLIYRFSHLRTTLPSSLSVLLLWLYPVLFRVAARVIPASSRSKTEHCGTFFSLSFVFYIYIYISDYLTSSAR